MGGWLLPVIHLSNNVLSMTGVLLVTTSTVFWLFLLPSSFGAPVNNPYLGIVAYLLLPSVLVLGLILIPIGIYLRFRSERKKGSYPADFPPLTFHNVEFRRLILFVTLATLVNIVIAGQTGYKAVTYMEGASFCGETCHTVMQPEFVAYKNAAHSRVECVKCHIGPGAAWFLRSKLNGIHQVFAVTFNTYQRPIPPPLQKLRPASETCEECHAPDKFIGDRLRVVDKFADDEKNTTAKTVLLMRVGGARQGTGIHGVHMGPGVTVRYAPADESRQKITWVEYNNGRGRRATYASPDAKPGAAGKLPVRDMECMDCHNRPAHTFEVPESAVDRAMALGQIAPDLPFVREAVRGTPQGVLPCQRASDQRHPRRPGPFLSAELSGCLCQPALRHHSCRQGPGRHPRPECLPGDENHVGYLPEQSRPQRFSGLFPLSWRCAQER